jgi:penicillin amidase
VLNVKVSRHGPVMNGLITGLDNNEPVAMSWIYTQQPIHILDAVYTHMQKTKQIFKRGCSYFSPGLNVMYGDAKGNIAWWATGKLYKHNDGVDTHFILDGSSGKTILLNIWISQESVGSKPRMELCIFS